MYNRKIVTGIGSRQTPRKIFRLQVRMGMFFAILNWELRSGAAHGSDEAFELGFDLAASLVNPNMDLASVKHIYIPWENFRSRRTSEPGVRMPSMTAAIEMTGRYHPNWDRLRRNAQRLMARNAFQVLGADLDQPANVVVCYTKDGAESSAETGRDTGGTGQAIRIADDYGVKVVNIGNPSVREEWEVLLARFDERMVANNMDPTQKIVDEFLDGYFQLPTREGNLIEMADRGEFDVIIHGCNCFNTMGSGIAKAMAERWPEVVVADNMTKPGDKAKLGDYTSAPVTNLNGERIKVINGYTQFRYGKDPMVCYVDYEKLRRLFQTLESNGEFRDGATGLPARVGIPMIGAGLGNGEWFVIERLIREAAPDANLTLVVLG